MLTQSLCHRLNCRVKLIIGGTHWFGNKPFPAKSGRTQKSNWAMVEPERDRYWILSTVMFGPTETEMAWDALKVVVVMVPAELH